MQDSVRTVAPYMLDACAATVTQRLTCDTRGAVTTMVEPEVPPRRQEELPSACGGGAIAAYTSSSPEPAPFAATIPLLPMPAGRRQSGRPYIADASSSCRTTAPSQRKSVLFCEIQLQTRCISGAAILRYNRYYTRFS